MKVDILTIFPTYFENPLSLSLFKIAQEKGALRIQTHDLRDFTDDPHRQVDDSPYGGGPGMVMKPGPFYEGVFSILGVRSENEAKEKARVILLTPQGKTFSQKLAEELAQESHLVFLCARYEGVDERVRELSTDEISIGDYVLAGGEGACLVILEALVRLLPGVVGEAASLVEESFSQGLLEYPQYTRPQTYRGRPVPDVLLSGNHQKIAEWRRKEALKRTFLRRPDLLKNIELSKEEREYLNNLRKQLEEEKI
jgi:tRNA (guanine37-N1)-methyltransferase